MCATNANVNASADPSIAMSSHLRSPRLNSNRTLPQAHNSRAVPQQTNIRRHHHLQRQSSFTTRLASTILWAGSEVRVALADFLVGVRQGWMQEVEVESQKGMLPQAAVQTREGATGRCRPVCIFSGLGLLYIDLAWNRLLPS